MKKSLRLASLAVLLAAGFALGANQALNIFAAAKPKPQPAPASSAKPASSNVLPTSPDPFPCLPKCPGS